MSNQVWPGTGNVIQHYDVIIQHYDVIYITPQWKHQRSKPGKDLGKFLDKRDTCVDWLSLMYFFCLKSTLYNTIPTWKVYPSQKIVHLGGCQMRWTTSLDRQPLCCQNIVQTIYLQKMSEIRRFRLDNRTKFSSDFRRSNFRHSGCSVCSIVRLYVL